MILVVIVARDTASFPYSIFFIGRFLLIAFYTFWCGGALITFFFFSIHVQNGEDIPSVSSGEGLESYRQLRWPYMSF